MPEPVTITLPTREPLPPEATAEAAELCRRHAGARALVAAWEGAGAAAKSRGTVGAWECVGHAYAAVRAALAELGPVYYGGWWWRLESGRVAALRARR